jgi:uncharacterized protein YecT (DUF1311 family)
VEEALDRWDEEMNAVYQKLIERLPSKSTLVEAQRTWLVFRDAEYLLIDLIDETLPSQEYRLLHAYWRLRLTRERAFAEEVFGACRLGKSNELNYCSCGGR